MREFYSVLLPKGAVVFDIGANIGTMTRVFASEGAKVIAVEPNPDCIRHIERTTSRDTVEVLQAAVGEVNGLGVIRISDRKDKMSSLSAEWREAVAKDNRDYAGMWKREITVPVITLDTLIHRYGLPFYIKIDVEGYEEHVLRGLSGLPALLSLEFNRLLLEPILRALDSAVFAEASFNFTLIDPVRFEEAAVAAASQKVDDAQSRLAETRLKETRIMVDIRQDEEFISHDENSAMDRKGAEDTLSGLKAGFAQLQVEEQQWQTKEMEADDRLRTERAKLVEIQDQLDLMDRILEK
jgi:FkbM family methyltransferase